MALHLDVIVKSTLLLSFSLLHLSSYANNTELQDGGWFGTAMVAVVDDDQDRNVDDGFSNFHFGVGQKYSPKSSVEYNFIFNSAHADGFNADQKQWGLGADYIRNLGSTENFLPYALVGLGYIKTQNDSLTVKDGGGVMASLGIGVLTPIDSLGLLRNSRGFMLRTEMRLRKDKSVNSRTDFLLSFGVQRSFRLKSPVERDEDKDGIPDTDDRCGATPPNSSVDSFGCAQSHTSDDGKSSTE